MAPDGWGISAARKKQFSWGQCAQSWGRCKRQTRIFTARQGRIFTITSDQHLAAPLTSGVLTATEAYPKRVTEFDPTMSHHPVAAELLAAIQSKRAKAAVIGLGYVGLPLAMSIARAVLP